MYQDIIPIRNCVILKLFKVLSKEVYWCHLLSSRCVCSFQNKQLLEIFPFLSNNCQKICNMRTGTEIVNPCILYFIRLSSQNIRLRSLRHKRLFGYIEHLSQLHAKVHSSTWCIHYAFQQFFVKTKLTMAGRPKENTRRNWKNRWPVLSQ